MESVRWGIMGTGRIAGAFAAGVQELPDATLAAVGSRAAETAEAFGERFGIPRRHASYADLAHDPEVDIVYVATPHPLHAPCAGLCLEAGKAVLVEKPFTVNAAEARDLVRLARERDVFLMEAMWTRFLPLMARCRQLVAGGAIGEPRVLLADFGFRHDFDPAHRLFDPRLAGGALLDVGVYLVSLASMFFGPAERVASLAHLGATGVDEQAALALGYGDGRLAQLTAAVRTVTPQEATLAGTDGMIRIHSPWWKPTVMTLTVAGQPPETVEVPFEGNGYGYEAAEAMRCLRAGHGESQVIPLAETVAIMETLDRLRVAWGLRYPME